MTTIPVSMIEFHEGGKAIWIHNDKGSTVLRIQCTGQIKIRRGCENICAHADINVAGDIEICMKGKPRRKRKPLLISSANDIPIGGAK